MINDVHVTISIMLKKMTLAWSKRIVSCHPDEDNYDICRPNIFSTLKLAKYLPLQSLES